MSNAADPTIAPDQNIAQYLLQVLNSPSLTIPASEVQRIVASQAWLARIARGEVMVIAKPAPAVGPGAADAAGPEKAGGTA